VIAPSARLASDARPTTTLQEQRIILSTGALRTALVFDAAS
jgi:hypothetical protein